jgi:hypothetical protein
MKQKIIKELKEIGLVTAYFFVCFIIVLTLKKLLLSEYTIKFYALHTAIISALIVAKVVVILDKTPLGSIFDSKSFLFKVLWRTSIYTLMVFLVTLLEHLFEYYQEKGSLALACLELWEKRNFAHFIALNMCVGVSLLLYNIYEGVDKQLGAGTLRRIIWSK